MPVRHSTKCKSQLIVDLATERDELLTFIFGGILLTALAGAAFLVLRQILLGRELSLGIKSLATKVREGQASAMDQFEFGLMLLEKDLFT